MLVSGVLTDREIAEGLDVCPETLSRWKQSEVFQEALQARLVKEDRLRRLQYRARANYAAERLMSLMDSESPRVALAAVKEILRLAGDGPGQDVQDDKDDGGVIVLPDMR